MRHSGLPLVIMAIGLVSMVSGPFNSTALSSTLPTPVAQEVAPIELRRITDSVALDPRVLEIGLDPDLLNAELYFMQRCCEKITAWGPFSGFLSQVFQAADAGQLNGQTLRSIEARYLIDGDDLGVAFNFRGRSFTILFNVYNGEATPSWVGSDRHLDPVENLQDHYAVARILKALLGGVD